MMATFYLIVKYINKNYHQMKTYIIYCAECLLNNKKYIGYTNSNKGFERRKYEHIHLATEGHKTKFYNCLRKYPNDFEWSIIMDNIEKHTTAKELEKYFIKKYDTYKNGLNSTEGGDGGRTRENQSGHNAPTYKFIDNETTEFIIQSYKNGLGKSYIVKNTGLSFTKINNVLKENNIEYIPPINVRKPPHKKKFGEKKIIKQRPQTSRDKNPKWKNISIEEQNAIIESYQIENNTMKFICEKFNIGRKLLLRIFIDNNIPKKIPQYKLIEK